MLLEKTCLHCQAPFTTARKTGRPQTYCTPRCTALAAHYRHAIDIDCQLCGKPIKVARYSKAARRGYGWCSNSCAKRATAQPRLDSNGYLTVPIPAGEEHLAGKARGWTIEEHRLVMARSLGRALLPTETVHHINGDRLDNRLDNLELWASRHTAGQRISDCVADAVAILEQYAPDRLAPTASHAKTGGGTDSSRAPLPPVTPAVDVSLPELSKAAGRSA